MQPWIIPTVKAGAQVVKHRNEIKNLWDRFLNLFASKTRIAVTGMPGVGKTVLFDYILEKAYGRNYTRPLTSQQAEKGVIKLEGKSLEFIVVPGQQQNPRIVTETLLIDKKPPDGIIHLFANGYANVRDSTARNALIEDGFDTIDKIRQENISRELEDLKKTCDLITRIHNKHNKPMWIAFVANKVDLYAEDSQLKEAENKYTPNSDATKNSAIVEEIEKLVNQIGKNNIRWQSFYTCSRIEAFEWNNQRHMTTLVDENQRDKLLKDFLISITNYCKSK